jgi:hypothetical protein
MSSEVSIKRQRRIFTTFLNRSLNCLPNGQQYLFQGRPKKTEQTLSAESFFKTLIDLSLDFFQKLCVTFSFGSFQTFWTHCM